MLDGSRHRYLLLAMLSCNVLLSMEKSRPISGDISDLSWTAQGTSLFVGSKKKKAVRIFNISNNRLEQQSTLRTESPVIKIACSPSQNAVAFGLSNGMVELFANNQGTLEPGHTIVTEKKEIHELCWIGDTANILIYFKDREADVPGTDRHYAHTSVLRVFDSTQGSLIKEFTLPNHVIKVELPPSGKAVAIVSDLFNRRENALGLEDKGIRQALQLYSLSEEFSVEARMRAPYCPESTIQALSWSRDSTALAALLDNGTLLLFNEQGVVLKEYSLDTCKHLTGTIDWSPINNYLAIPATLNTIQIYAPLESEEVVETIALEDYLTKLDPQKAVFATKVAWSPSQPELAILCTDLGCGAASSERKLIVAQILGRKKKQRRIGTITPSDLNNL